MKVLLQKMNRAITDMRIMVITGMKRLTHIIKAGIPIGYLSIQNEPDYTASYESCNLDFTESAKGASYPEAFAAAYDAVSRLDNPPKLLGPETMSCEKGTLSLYIDAILKLKPERLIRNSTSPVCRRRR